MNTWDRLRIRLAAERYRFWLDARGAERARRRDLRDELQANLVEAAERVGVGPAIAALGGTRRLAAAATTDDTGPRWGRGAIAGAIAFAAVMVMESLAMINYVSGALDVATDADATGSLVPFPGSSVSVQADTDRFALAWSTGWLPFIVGLAAFVVVSRPWRLLAAAPAALS